MALHNPVKPERKPIVLFPAAGSSLFQYPFPECLDSRIAPGVGCRDETAPRRRLDLPVEERDQRAPFHLPRDHPRVSDSRPHALDDGVDHHAVEAEARCPREVRRRLALAREPGRRPGFQARRAQFRQRRQMRQKMVEFLKAEGAVATLEASRGEHGTLFVGSGGSRDPEKEMPLPGIVLAIEHYNRIKRLLKSEVPVKIELEFQARYHQEDLNGYNVVAEIPGNDPNLADELVMLGAHIDSWHAGTGATDNAAGVAVTMEAARIIQALDLKPRRTIRIGLWSGNVVRPAFPDVSFKEEVTGVVVAWIETDEQGDVVSVTILQSPNKEIGSAVKKALARWRFAPTTLKGKPVRVAGKLTFYYEIENGVGLVLSPEEKRALRARRPLIVRLRWQSLSPSSQQASPWATVSLPDQHALHRDIGDRRECMAGLRGSLEGIHPKARHAQPGRVICPC